MNTRERLAKVINLFEHLINSTLASQAKGALKVSAKVLQALSDNHEIDDEILKVQTDLIIVGSVIHALCKHAAKYNFGAQFPDHYLYSRTPQAVWKGLSNLEGEDFFIAIGQRALQTKTLPFTGRFDDMKYKNKFSREVMPIFQGYDNDTKQEYALGDLFEPGHFESYELDTDPMTVDPTELNRPAKQRRAQDEAARALKEEQKKKDDKWHRPFGLKEIRVFTPLRQYTLEEDVFSENKKRFIQRIDAFQHEHNMRLLTWAGYVLLAVVVAPFTLLISLAFTVPWLIKKYNNIQEIYDNRDIVTLEFTAQEYDAVIEKRASVKSNFPDSTLSEKNERKPGKVCVAFDADENEVRTQQENHKTTKRVLMYCDKAQAKRWSLSFLDTATQATYEQAVKESEAIDTNYYAPKNSMS